MVCFSILYIAGNICSQYWKSYWCVNSYYNLCRTHLVRKPISSMYVYCIYISNNICVCARACIYVRVLMWTANKLFHFSSSSIITVHTLNGSQKTFRSGVIEDNYYSRIASYPSTRHYIKRLLLDGS